MLNTFLYGIMVSQCYSYYSKYRRDPLWMKALVTSLLIADTMNTIFGFCWIYGVVINHFADVSALTQANWVFATDPVMVGTTATIVQVFFAWRVKVLTGCLISTAAIVLTATTSFLGSLGTTIAVVLYPEFIHFQRFRVIVIVWLVSSVVCDITITATISWYLRHYQAGFPESDGTVSKVIRITVQNGLITSVAATVDLISYLATPSGLHLAFNFPLSKLYTNVLMASLHSRAGWRYGNADSAMSRADPMFTSQVVMGRDGLPTTLPTTDFEDCGYELHNTPRKACEPMNGIGSNQVA